MTDLRPTPKPRPLGSLLPRLGSSLTSATVPDAVREAARDALFDASTQELAKAVAWGNLARGLIADTTELERSYEFRGFDVGGRAGWLEGLGGTIGGLLPKSIDPGEEEPFLHVKITHYPEAPAAPEVFHFSDIDRPVGKGVKAIQLDGRVLDLASCSRRMATESGIARLQTTLRLANTDAELNRLFRSPDFLKARIEVRVGFRSLPPDWYRRVGPVWRVDRLAAITPRYVELSLIDATDGLFGYMQDPPTKQELRTALGLSTTTPPDGYYDEPHLPVPFGGEWIKAFELEREEYVSGSNGFFAERHRICLGATKNSAAIVQLALWNVVFGDADHDWLIGELADTPEETRAINLLVAPGCKAVPETFRGRITSAPVTAPDGEPWHAAILELEYAPSGGDIANWDFATDLYNKARDGKLWVRWPNGAEGHTEVNGYAWRGKHDPVSLIQHLATHYMAPRAHQLLHQPSFEAARREFVRQNNTGTKFCGGTYELGADGGTVITSLAKTYNLDLWWGADGLLHISTQYFDQRSLTGAAAGALVYDAEWEILRDTWTETIPIGSERWGIANRFRYSGEKDYTRPGLASTLGIDRSEGLQRQWGRILEAGVSWAWLVSAYVNLNGRAYSWPDPKNNGRGVQRTIATFYAPLFALELEPGDFIRINHFGGSQSDDGYDRRLFRVEEVGLEWSGKRVKIVAVDMRLEEERQSAVFDDETKWSRLLRLWPDGKNQILAGGTSSITLSGPGFKNVKIGDLVLIDDDDDGVHVNAKILAFDPGTGAATVDELVPAGAFARFNVQRTHLDPPTDIEFPGIYPLGARFYFRACDELTGQFSDGSPGFRAEAI